MPGKGTKKVKSRSQKKSKHAESHVSRQAKHNAEPGEVLTKPPEEVIASHSDKNGGEEDVRPSLKALGSAPRD